MKRSPAEVHRFHYCFPAHITVEGNEALAESTNFCGGDLPRGLQKDVPFLVNPSPAHPLFRRLCVP